LAVKKVLAFVFAAGLSATVAQAQLYAVSSAEGGVSDVGNLLILDPANGDILEKIPLSFSSGGSLIDMGLGIVGIAVRPETGVLYVILDESDRSLATVDPVTGIVVKIGELGDFCGLTFGSDGTLYAVASEHHSDSGAVYTVNLATAATLLFRASDDTTAGGFPSGGGQSIEFNPADGRLYFANEAGPDGNFSRMDLGTKTASTVPLSDDALSQAIAYEVESGTFLMWYDETDEFFRVDPSTGDVTIEGTNTSEGNQLRGFAFARSSSPHPAPLLGGIGIAVLVGFFSLIGLHRISRRA
jgi:DNA-binding beta-propeller fold protein YncE